MAKPIDNSVCMLELRLNELFTTESCTQNKHQDLTLKLYLLYKGKFVKANLCHKFSWILLSFPLEARIILFVKWHKNLSLNVALLLKQGKI